MFPLLMVLVVSVGAPLAVDYWRAPEENILTRSREDVVQGVTHAVTAVQEVVLHQGTAHPMLEELPAWAQWILLQCLRLVLRLFHPGGARNA